MKTLQNALLACLLAASCPVLGAQQPESPSLQVLRLGDRILVVSDGVLGMQLAVNSREGIVVFGTLWSGEAAGRFRSRIEAEFGRKDFAAVVLWSPRLDNTGGGSAYGGIESIAGERSRRMLTGFRSMLPMALQPLVEMWRWKEGVSRDRLRAGNLDPYKAAAERAWADMCRRVADDLSSGYDLRLPERTFRDRMTIDLGDMRLELIDMDPVGEGWPGTVARIPELGLVAFGPMSFHVQHLLPYQNVEPWQDLQVPRALSLLDGILDAESEIRTLVVGSGLWPVSELKARRRYMGDLWGAVRDASGRGLPLERIRADLSVDARFPYLKDLEVWRTQGAAWCLKEHDENIARFHGQQREYAAREVLRAARDAGTGPALAKYREIRDGKDPAVVFDDRSMDSLVEVLFREGDLGTALAVVRENAEAFPRSAPVQARLRQAQELSGQGK